MKGGKVIASGGFGCVFKPALKCTNGNIYNGITKLMFNKYIQSEILEMEIVKKKVVNIKNYKDYFLVDNIESCKINKLNQDDLYNILTCNSLKKHGINEYNINYNLDKLSALQIPDGGIDIQKFIQYNNYNKDLILINNLLIKLLKNAIIPMNKNKLFHFDIKGANVLYKKNKIRLIDWGLAGSQKTNEIIEAAKRRPFQFNSPLSIILFHEDFKSWYLNKLINKHSLYDIVNEWILYNNEDGGKGHYNLIRNIIDKSRTIDLENKILNKFKSHANKNNYSKNVIIYNLVSILEKYTNKKTMIFDDIKYFNDVFKVNVDIWGFIMIYKSYTYSYNLKMIKQVKYIINHYLYDTIYSTKPINIKNLINDLKQITKILEPNKDVSYFTNESIIKLSKEYKEEGSVFRVNDINFLKNIKKKISKTNKINSKKISIQKPKIKSKIKSKKKSKKRKKKRKTKKRKRKKHKSKKKK